MQAVFDSDDMVALRRNIRAEIARKRLEIREDRDIYAGES